MRLWFAALRRTARLGLVAGLLLATGLTTAIVIAAPPAQQAAAAPTAAPSGAMGWSLRLLGEQRLPYRYQFEGTIVGGLSGIDYDPARNIFYLISDDRSDLGPARFYTAALAIDTAGFNHLALLSTVALRKPDGRTYPGRPASDVVDPEAIRFDPRTGTLLWTNEGERAIGPFNSRFFDKRLADPSLRESALDGRFIAEWPIPKGFRMRAEESGPRTNSTFEGLSLSVDGQSLWLAMEGPLYEDGPLANRSRGALVRISRLARAPQAEPSLLAQYAYRTEALPHAPWLPGAPVEQGITEILSLDDQRLLVLERGYVFGHGMTARLFEADSRDASDVANLASLASARISTMKKTLLLDFARLGLPRLDNIEGMSWGPTLANGHRTLVFVSDDNFNFLQSTQFLAFELIPPTRP